MKLAAIPYGPGQGEAVDALLREVAAALRKEGRALAGAVQWNEAKAGQSRCDMVLENLASGERFDVSADPRGNEEDCRLNSYALEHVAGIVAASIKPGIDLVILNRFGKQEAARAGFRSTIEAAVANELPLVTALNSAHRQLWQAFTGGEAIFLDNDTQAVKAWCDTCLSS